MDFRLKTFAGGVAARFGFLRGEAMSIGEALAQARHRAGLTVAEVSERTRIREAVISGIEDDDYSGCGGDVYVRGHIRAIAKVTGTDPVPLIRQYDLLHRAGSVAEAVSLEELPAAGAKARRRRRLTLAALRGPAASTCASVPRRVAWAVVLGALVAIAGLGVPELLPGPPHAAAGPPAARKQAPARGPARYGAPGREPKASPPAAQPAAVPSPPARTLTPAGASAFGPRGGDNPQLAHLAISGRRGGWHTDWYTTARFGNLYPGTGLLLNMGQMVAITSARISLGRGSGASFQLRIGAGPALSDLPPVARAADADGVVWLRLAKPAPGRYVLVWFTRLPADLTGTFQARIFRITLKGLP